MSDAKHVIRVCACLGLSSHSSTCSREGEYRASPDDLNHVLTNKMYILVEDS